MTGKSPPIATPTILTIGYERLCFSDFLDAIAEAGVETLIDVRELPNSRRAGQHNSSMQANGAKPRE